MVPGILIVVVLMVVVGVGISFVNRNASSVENRIADLTSRLDRLENKSK